MNIDRTPASFSALDQELAQDLADFQPFALARRQVFARDFAALQKIFGQENYSTKQTDAMPKETIIQLLPTTHKIAVCSLLSSSNPVWQNYLFRTCLRLCPAHFASFEVFVKEFNQFREEVGALTEGMITNSALTALRVFRMRLFATIDRTLKHIQGEKKYTFGGIGSLKNEFRNCKKDLLIAFGLFDADKVDYSREDVERALRCGLVLFESLWEAIKDKRDRPILLEDVKLVNQLLKLIQKGAAHPTSFLPILLLPLQNVKWVLHGVELNPQVERWLSDFSSALQIHLELLATVVFSKAVKKNRTLLKEVCQKVSDQASVCTREINSLVNVFFAYETLPAADQRKQMDGLAEISNNVRKASQSLQDLTHAYSALMDYIDQLTKETRPGQSINQCVQHPYCCYINLAYGMLETLKQGVAHFMTFHQTIEEVLPPDFHFFQATLIDLIDLRIRQENTPSMQSHLQLLIQVLHEMRQAYAPGRFNSVLSYAESTRNTALIATMEPVAASENPLYRKVYHLLRNGLKTRSWPKLFLKNPFADEAESQRLETRYYYAWSQVVYDRFDTLPNIDHPLAERCRQKALSGKLEPVEKYKPAARLFWEEISLLSLEVDKWEEQLTCFDPENPLKEQIQNFQKQLKIYFLSPGQAIKAFLTIEGEEKAVKKTSRVVRKNRALLRPTVDWSPRIPVQAKIANPPLKEKTQTFADFEKAVRLLGDRCLAFQLTNANSNQARLNALQQSSALNLLNSLAAIKELVPHLTSCGHLPFFIHALYLKMSVALEQALILTTAHLTIYKDPEDKEHALLKARGQECWQTHDLLNFKKLLENYVYRTTKTFLFTPESRALLEKLSRVVGISGRHPASGHDELSYLLMKGGRSDLMEGRWNQAQGTLLRIFKVINFEGQEALENPFSDQELECLTLVKNDPVPQWRDEASVFLQSFQDQVRGLLEFLSFPHNGLVPLIDEYDESCKQRQGTILSCMNDIAIHLNTLESLLHFHEDPSLCLTLAEEALLAQASILENVFLIVLSYLPERYLWEETKPRPPRYLHQIDKFAERLHGCGKREVAFYQKTCDLSNQLAHYLKHSFRYYQPSLCPATQLRDHFRTLSILRDRLAQGAPSASIDKYLPGPGDPMQKLNNYIARALVLRIKLPALETLKIAREWLTIYEEFLE